MAFFDPNERRTIGMAGEYRDSNYHGERRGGSGNRDNRGGRSGGYNQRRDDRGGRDFDRKDDRGYRGDRDDRRNFDRRDDRRFEDRGPRGGHRDDERGQNRRYEERDQRGHREDRGDRRPGDRGGYRDDRRGGRDFDRRDDRRDSRGYEGDRRDSRGPRNDRRFDDRRGERDFDRRDDRGGRGGERRFDDRRDNRGPRGDRRFDDRERGGFRGDRRDDRGYQGDRRDNRGPRNDRRFDDRGERDFRGDRRDFAREDSREQRDFRGERQHDARDYRETSDGFEFDEDRDESSRGGWYNERRDERERNRGYSDRRDGRKPAPRKDRDERPRKDDRSPAVYAGEEQPFMNRQDRRAAAAAEREREAAESYEYIDFEDRDWDDDAWIDDDDDDAPAPRHADPAMRRVEVRCPVSKRCGGCEWLAMPYEEQLEAKQDHIEELFSNYKAEPEPIIGMEEPWGYRNKVQLPFAPGKPDRDGRITARWGIFERGSHVIVPCRQCLVEDERARPIIATVADLLPRLNIKPYHEKKGEGLLRYVLVRTAHVTGQVMVTLVCNGNRIPAAKTFLDRLLTAHPEITTVVLNVNTEKTSVILGKEEHVLYGPGYIEDELCGCRFRISSSSFYQTNPIAAEALYNLAVEMADLKPGDRIGDAYCGTGTIGIVAAKQSGAHLLGVERNADAVEDARINARRYR